MSADTKIYALLVGVNEYSSPAIRNLNFAVADVVAVRDWLSRRGGLSAGHSILLASPSIGEGDVPTRTRFLDALNQFNDMPMGEDDTFLLYFAGHGFSAGDDAYLLTADSNRKSALTLEDTAVSFSRLQRYIRLLRAGHQVVILDACRNDPGALERGAGDSGVTDAMARNIGVLAKSTSDQSHKHRVRRAILSACWQGQVSYEYPNGSHSWFCHNLMHCLNEHGGSRIDIADLSERIETRMRERAGLEFPDAEEQLPHLILDGGRVWFGPGISMPNAMEPQSEQPRIAPEKQHREPAIPIEIPSFEKRGTTKVNPRDGQTYVWIPPGTFRMGCSPADVDGLDDAKPAHNVTISRGFWIGQTPVTQRAFQNVMDTNPSLFKGDDFPVDSVTWDQAARYGLSVGMRLPTEAEWEWAARAENTSPAGDLQQTAWFSANSGRTSHPVASKQPNGYGLYDMLGNVWEWVEDWYGPYDPADQTDPAGPASGRYRVARGGSWSDVAKIVQVTCRGRGEPGRGYYFGFRCASHSL